MASNKGDRSHDHIVPRLRYCQRIKPCPLSINPDMRSRRRLIPVLATFKAWLDEQANAVLPKSAMGTAVSYTLKNWEALTRFTEQGYLEPDNNYAEQCLLC